MRAVASTGSTKQQMGQFFTVDPRVQELMVSMVTTAAGTALEPSAGAGHLAAALAAARPGLSMKCVEYDSSINWTHPFARDTGEFLSWSVGREASFDVVIANPPYVAWKDAPPAIKNVASAFADGWHGKVNMYHLFIERCAELLKHNGEMVFIVPMDWMFQTATAPLREKLAKLGAVTHVAHLGEERVFPDADVPSLCVFRFKRGAAMHTLQYKQGLDGTWQTRTLMRAADRWLLLDARTADLVSDWLPLSTQYEVRVGMVTGLDAAFRVSPGAVEAEAIRAVLTTRRTLEHFIDVNSAASEAEVPPLALAHLREHKEALLARRIRRFDEGNWWQWGAVRNAPAMESRAARFYALAKTREERPFFTFNGKPYHSAGVLGLYRRTGALPVATAVKVANSPEFRAVLEGMLLTTNDKVQLQPATLGSALFPATAEQVAAISSMRSGQ